MSVRFNGVDLQEDAPYSGSTVCLGRGTYGAPERDVEQIHVPGRNGDLLLDHGCYKNIQVTYPCSILDHNSEVSQWLRDVLYSARGYCRLEDDYHPGEFRLAEYRGPFEPEVFSERGNDTAKVDLVFNCKPQRFLNAGEEKILFCTGGSDGNGKDVYAINAKDRNFGGKTLRIAYYYKPGSEYAQPTIFSVKYSDTNDLSNWIDITSAVQREPSDYDFFVFTVTIPEGEIYEIQFTVNNEEEHSDLREVRIGDTKINTEFGQSVHNSGEKYGPPTIWIKGIKNADSDKVVVRYLKTTSYDTSFEIDISEIPDGECIEMEIDCENMYIVTKRYNTGYPPSRYEVNMIGNYPRPDGHIKSEIQLNATGMDYITACAQTHAWRI